MSKPTPKQQVDEASLTYDEIGNMLLNASGSFAIAATRLVGPAHAPKVVDAAFEEAMLTIKGGFRPKVEIKAWFYRILIKACSTHNELLGVQSLDTFVAQLIADPHTVRIFVKRGIPEHDAPAVLLDACERALERWPTFDPSRAGGNFRPWFLGCIVRDVCSDYWRHQRHPDSPGTAVTVDTVLDLATPPSAEDQLEMLEQLRFVSRTFRPTVYEPYLDYLNGKPIAELAKAHGLTAEGMRGRLNTNLEFMRKSARTFDDFIKEPPKKLADESDSPHPSKKTHKGRQP